MFRPFSYKGEMTIEEKVGKTLEEMGVNDVQGVQALFAEARSAMETEKQKLVSSGAVDSAERDRYCKQLRDRWLARKNG